MIKRRSVIIFLFWLTGVAVGLGVLFGSWAWFGRPQSLPERDLSLDHKLPCVSYTPLKKNEAPWDFPLWKFPKGFQASTEQMEQDLALLATETECIRTYSAMGISGLPALAEKHGLKLLLGAWVNADKKATARELAAVIALAKQNPHLVKGVIVGNEALLRKEVSEAQLKAYIEIVRRALVGVPVTYADVWEFWLQHPKLANSVDFVTIHILPYWENDPAAIDTAVSHVDHIYQKLARVFSNHPILIGETGWPSVGRMREGARPSRVNQARFIRGVVALAEKEGYAYNVIEAFDQPWKRASEGAVGGYWGLFDANRVSKNVLRGPISEEPEWRSYALGSCALFAVVWSFYFPLCKRGVGGIYRFPSIKILQYLVAVFGSLILVFYLREAILCVRNNSEIMHASVLGVFAILAWIFILYRLQQGSRMSILSTQALRARYVAVLLSRRLIQVRSFFSSSLFVSCLMWAGVFSFLFSLMGFIFDARYRSFPTFGYILPVLALMTCFKKQDPATHTDQIKEGASEFVVLSVLFALGAVFVFFNETWRNVEAWPFVVLILGVSFALYRQVGAYGIRPVEVHVERGVCYTPLQGSGMKRAIQVAILRMTSGLSFLRRHKFFSIACVLSYLAITWVRYTLLEDRSRAAFCEDTPHAWICRVRDIIGMGIYFQVLGKGAFVTGLIGYLGRYRRLSQGSLCLSVMGLVLYDLKFASVACVFALLGLVLHPRFSSSSAQRA